jgi:catechol 2,3-dioxygenase-like lactoylglutathione lyase family enzyme
MITNIRHSCITTKDLKRCLSFYRDFLGLKVIVQKSEEGSYIENLLGLKDVKLTYVKLRSKDNPIPVLEIYYFDDGREVNIGNFHHIAFTVDNIKSLKSFLVGKGVPPLSEPQLDHGKKNLVMFCRDYDGNLIEFVEVL